MSDQNVSDDECYIIDESDEDGDNKDSLLTNGVSNYFCAQSSYSSESSLPISLNPLSVSSNDCEVVISGDTVSFIQSGEHGPKLLLNYNEKCELFIHQALNKLCDLREVFKRKLSDFRNRLYHVTQQPVSEKKKPLLFNQPYFFDIRHFHPPLNQETLERKGQKCFEANFNIPRPWTLKESKHLITVIKNSAVELSIKPLKLRYAFLKSKHEGDQYLTEKEELDISEEMDQIEDQIEIIKREYPEIHLEKNSEKLDWLHISSVGLNGFRSAEDCEIMYKYYLHKDIKKECFTPEEDARLKEIALAYCERNWDAIAEELGTNRTGIQCHQRYSTRLDEGFMKKTWTPADDEALIRTVENIKVGEYVPWKKVSFLLPEWSHIQALNRWERNLKPQNKSGFWLPEEDAILCLGVPAIGRCWTKFAQLFCGRTSYLCRERYTNVLDPLLVTGNWTVEEDTELLIKIGQYGERWGKISTYLPSRTDNMVNQRALKIKMAKPKLYEKILKCSNEDEVRKLLPKHQLVPSKNCTVLNERRKKIREAAFTSAQNALKQVLGHQIDLSEYKTFNDFASVIHFNNLKEIADILAPKDVILKRPISVYIKPFIKKDDSDQETEVLLVHEDTKSDGKPSSSESDDSYTDVDLSDDLSEVIKTENVVDLSSEIQSAIRVILLPLAVHGPISEKKTFVKGIKESYELSIVTSYVYKAFKLENPNQNDEEGEYILYKVNFSDTVTRLMLFLVFPRCTDDEILLIPPNPTSCTAVLLFPMCLYYINDDLSKLSFDAVREIEKICYSQPNFSVLCLYCESTFQSKMQVEGQSDDTVLAKNCRCSVIQKYVSKWKKFRSRMIFLLLWTELLSRMPPDAFQFESSRFQYRSMMANRFKLLKPTKRTSKKRRGRKRKQSQSHQTQIIANTDHQVGEDVAKKKRGRKPKQIQCILVSDKDHHQNNGHHHQVSEEEDDEVIIVSSD